MKRPPFMCIDEWMWRSSRGTQGSGAEEGICGGAERTKVTAIEMNQSASSILTVVHTKLRLQV